MTTPKENLIYEQNCNEFRSLNSFFWQIPLIMMTLNGGLWYSVATLDLDVIAQRGVLIFAGLANVTMAIGIFRLRSVMAELLQRIHAFDGAESKGPARLIQWLFITLMAAAAAGALLACWDPKARFTRTEAKPIEAHVVWQAAPQAITGTPAKAVNGGKPGG